LKLNSFGFIRDDLCHPPHLMGRLPGGAVYVGVTAKAGLADSGLSTSARFIDYDGGDSFPQ
jgi:hypothetical protein